MKSTYRIVINADGSYNIVSSDGSDITEKFPNVEIVKISDGKFAIKNLYDATGGNATKFNPAQLEIDASIACANVLSVNPPNIKSNTGWFIETNKQYHDYNIPEGKELTADSLTDIASEYRKLNQSTDDEFPPFGDVVDAMSDLQKSSIEAIFIDIEYCADPINSIIQKSSEFANLSKIRLFNITEDFDIGSILSPSKESVEVEIVLESATVRYSNGVGHIDVYGECSDNDKRVIADAVLSSPQCGAVAEISIFECYMLESIVSLWTILNNTVFEQGVVLNTPVGVGMFIDGVHYFKVEGMPYRQLDPLKVCKRKYDGSAKDLPAADIIGAMIGVYSQIVGGAKMVAGDTVHGDMYHVEDNTSHAESWCFQALLLSGETLEIDIGVSNNNTSVVKTDSGYSFTSRESMIARYQGILDRLVSGSMLENNQEVYYVVIDGIAISTKRVDFSFVGAVTKPYKFLRDIQEAYVIHNRTTDMFFFKEFINIGVAKLKIPEGYIVPGSSVVTSYPVNDNEYMFSAISPVLDMATVKYDSGKLTLIGGRIDGSAAAQFLSPVHTIDATRYDRSISDLPAGIPIIIKNSFAPKQYDDSAVHVLERLYCELMLDVVIDGENKTTDQIIYDYGSTSVKSRVDIVSLGGGKYTVYPKKNWRSGTLPYNIAAGFKSIVEKLSDTYGDNSNVVGIIPDLININADETIELIIEMTVTSSTRIYSNRTDHEHTWQFGEKIYGEMVTPDGVRMRKNSVGIWEPTTDDYDVVDIVDSDDVPTPLPYPDSDGDNKYVVKARMLSFSVSKNGDWDVTQIGSPDFVIPMASKSEIEGGGTNISAPKGTYFPDKQKTVTYTISKDDDGITVNYVALDEDGNDITDQFETFTFGNAAILLTEEV